MTDNLIKAMQVLGSGQQPNLVEGATLTALYDALSGVSKMDDLPGLVKATYNQSGSAVSGLTAYDLEAPAKLFYPVLTPLRNMIPRVSGKGGIQANWRAITGVNTALLNAGVSEGNRGGTIAVSTQDFTAAYKGIGFESSASFEAQYAGEGFDDVRMRAQQGGLHSLMLAEERMLLAGNGSLALGTTPTPSRTAGTSGGGLSDGTYTVGCVALTADGYFRNTVAGGLVTSYVRTNADGSTDTINGGTAQKSATGTVVLSGGTAVQKITASVTAVRGAAAYAWFWGTGGVATLGAITTVPTYVITAAATGTQVISSLPSTDNSIDTLAFSGLTTLAATSGSNSYWVDLAGATLTGDGVGGIVEIDALLKSQWDVFRLNPEIMWVSSQQANDLGKKILAGNANGAFRINVDMQRGLMGGGVMVATYLNKFGMNGATEVQIRQHPFISPGTILFTQASLPYPMNDTPNVFQVRNRQDYYSIEWPRRSRQYEYGVYADEVLQLFFPPAISLLTGIAAG